MRAEDAAAVSIAMHLVYFAPAVIFGLYYFFHGDISIERFRSLLSSENAEREIETRTEGALDPNLVARELGGRKGAAPTEDAAHRWESLVVRVIEQGQAAGELRRDARVDVTAGHTPAFSGTVGNSARSPVRVSTSSRTSRSSTRPCARPRGYGPGRLHIPQRS